jgi:acetyl-CoA/propionyl-CoA carboxylase carboxyl transferase subunit
MARLGGPEPHSRRSGLAALATGSDTHAIALARQLAVLFGRQGSIAAEVAGTARSVQDPALADGRGDVRPLIDGLFDRPGIELYPRWAPNVVTALGRLAGRTVGVVANNPVRLGGYLDAAAAEKAARFVRMCDAFGIPLVVLANVPGYLPSAAQEWEGLARRGAKLLFAFAEATVPRVTLITGVAHGTGYLTMNSRALGATRVFAWPGATVAGFDARDLSVIDETIDPAHTRQAIARAIAQAPRRHGAHRNVPL